MNASLEAILAAAEQHDASDILLHEGRAPVFRIESDLQSAESPALDAAFFEALRAECRAPEGTADFDGAFNSPSGTRYRASLLKNLGRHAAVLRKVLREIPDFAGLGLKADLFPRWLGREAGLVLLCGPTGSGKSTTIAACLNHIAANRKCHIVTIEDPIEFIFESGKSVFTQREVGLDTESFARGLRQSLRQSPDVIMVGEIRDVDTAVTAFQAAETGHLVLSTLHVSSATEAVERLQVFFPEQERNGVSRVLSKAILGVVCQRLLPGKEGGLVPALEYFTNVGLVERLIAENRLSDLADHIEKSDPSEASGFTASLAALCRDGKITEETALAHAPEPAELTRRLRGISSSRKS